LLGTWSCLEPQEQALIKGFVLNKFRGDQALLGKCDGLAGIPDRHSTVAIIPMLRHTLPEEDTVHHRAERDERHINIALIAYPMPVIWMNSTR